MVVYGDKNMQKEVCYAKLLEKLAGSHNPSFFLFPLLPPAPEVTYDEVTGRCQVDLRLQLPTLEVPAVQAAFLASGPSRLLRVDIRSLRLMRVSCRYGCRSHTVVRCLLQMARRVP